MVMERTSTVSVNSSLDRNLAMMVRSQGTTRDPATKISRTMATSFSKAMTMVARPLPEVTPALSEPKSGMRMSTTTVRMSSTISHPTAT